MAEGWTRHLHSDRIEVWSAGIETHGLNPMAVQAMKHAGVDISGHRSKLASELSNIQFDLVITVCGHADEHCPTFSNAIKVIHHGFDDPPDLAKDMTTEAEKLECYLHVCKEIQDFIKKL